MFKISKKLLVIASILLLVDIIVCFLIWHFHAQLQKITYLSFLTSLSAIKMTLAITVIFIGVFLFIVKYLQKKEGASEEASTSPPKLVSSSEALATTQIQERLAGIFSQAKDLEHKYVTKKLPAYIITGLKESGKTSLLSNSGLTFPLQVPPAGMTDEMCTWWFSDRVIFIELGYPDHDTQADLWSSGLKLLIKQKRPINGLILCIKINDFLENSDQKINKVTEVRRIIDAQLKAVGMRYPIYIIITQVDKLQGFTEFFSHLNAKEQHQLWGMTFPDEAREKGEWYTLIQQQFTDLLQRLRNRRDYQLSRELQSSVRAATYIFPEQLACLEKPLAHFMSEVFASNNYYEVPFIRGVFLTSSCQQGETLNPIAQLFQEQFLLGEQHNIAHMMTQKAYFTKSLFSHFILKEQNIKHGNTRAQSYFRLRYNLVNLLTIGIGVLFIGLWIKSYSINDQTLFYLQNALSDYQEQLNNDTQQHTDNNQHLQSLSELELINHLFDKESELWRSHFGLYVGDEVDEASRAAYQRVALLQFIPMLQDALGSQLQATSALALYQTLTVYLMLGEPEHRNNERIKQWFADYWQYIAPQSADQQAILLQLLDEYLAQKNQVFTLNDRWVDNARERLWQFSFAQLAYFYLEEQASILGNSNQNYTTLDVTNVARVFNIDNQQLRIPLLYTVHGLNNYYLQLRNDVLKNLYTDDWVLGDKYQLDLLDKKTIAQQIDRIYYSYYIAFWSNLISSLEVMNLRDINHAAQVVGVMAEVTSPMNQILQTVAQNTSLVFDSKAPNNEQLNQAAEVINPIFNQLNQLFVKPQNGNVPIVDINTSFNTLYKMLNLIRHGDNPQKTAFDLTLKFFKGEPSPINQLLTEATNTPVAVSGWLTQIADQSWSLILAEAAGYIDAQWQAQVYQHYHQLISNSYPFAKNASEQLSLIDFVDFFAPDELMDQFFSNYLAPFVNTDHYWIWSTLDGQSIGTTAESLEFLKQFKEIQKRFFNLKEKKIQINFSLKPTDLDANVKIFRLQINDRLIQYMHGPERETDFQWPGSGDTQGASIQFIDFKDREFSQRITGPWSLFKLLDNNDISLADGDKKYQITFTSNGYTANYNLLADRTYNPFNLNLLHTFYLPEKVVD